MPVPTFRGATPSTCLALAALLVATAGCRDTEGPTASAFRAETGGQAARTHLQYGVPVKVGDGRARTYVVLDQKTAAQLELGVALEERALENLPAVSVPRMGLHWLSLSSPELPPESKPFTATYIVGTWNGKVIFQEPMITRAFILGLRDGATFEAAFAVSSARRYEPAGLYPSG